jgi:hypothetical protein
MDWASSWHLQFLFLQRYRGGQNTICGGAKTSNISSRGKLVDQLGSNLSWRLVTESILYVRTIFQIPPTDLRYGGKLVNFFTFDSWSPDPSVQLNFNLNLATHFTEGGGVEGGWYPTHCISPLSVHSLWWNRPYLKFWGWPFKNNFFSLKWHNFRTWTSLPWTHLVKLRDTVDVLRCSGTPWCLRSPEVRFIGSTKLLQDKQADQACIWWSIEKLLFSEKNIKKGISAFEQ